MTRASRFRYPVLETLGSLPPDAGLCQGVEAPGFEVGGFCNGADAPAALLELLAQNGYEADDHEPGRGMLFASRHGVCMHLDEKPAVLWALSGPQMAAPEGLQFLVGSQRCFLSAGDVLLFDARREHGVISTEAGLWVVFSMYVRRSPTAGSPTRARAGLPT